MWAFRFQTQAGGWAWAQVCGVGGFRAHALEGGVAAPQDIAVLPPPPLQQPCSNPATTPLLVPLQVEKLQSKFDVISSKTRGSGQDENGEPHSQVGDGRICWVSSPDSLWGAHGCMDAWAHGHQSGGCCSQWHAAEPICNAALLLEPPLPIISHTVTAQVWAVWL